MFLWKKQSRNISCLKISGFVIIKSTIITLIKSWLHKIDWSVSIKVMSLEPDDGAAYAQSMEFNFPREKAPQSRFSRCLELYGEYKGIYGRKDPIVASRPLSFRFCWSILSRSGTIVRRGSRIHRIILADSFSYDGIYWPFLGIVDSYCSRKRISIVMLISRIYFL